MYKIAVILILIIGIENILSACLFYQPARIVWLKQYLPWIVTKGSWLIDLLAGTIQILLSWSLIQQKWQSWRAAIIVLWLDAAFNLIRGYYGHVIVILLALLILWLFKSWFAVTSNNYHKMDNISSQ
ncbi:hypothetical protein [Desulfotruncus arcticus]|uniref:hypothetical protein n=1 Tax=Desulfotruncus arcticus TaxID=341036 RepID=UPI0013F4D6F7|nr:hypothetical protein [Desulfotruncus arcticus]